MSHFHDLYEAAAMREHVEFLEARNLRESFIHYNAWLCGLESRNQMPMRDDTPPSLRVCGELARGLLDLYEEFLEKMDKLARERHMRVLNIPEVCPICRQPGCLGAVPVMQLPPGTAQQMLAFYLQHQKPTQEW